MSFKLTIDGNETDVISLVVPEYRDAISRCLAHSLQTTEGGFNGIISPASVLASGISSELLADALVPIAASFALCPVSQFRVGAIARCDSTLFLGMNMEFAGGSIHLSVHGEQAAITQAIEHGFGTASNPIDCIHVSALPCGHCRQLLVETQYIQGKHPITIHVIGKDSVPLNSLIPQAFTAEDLTTTPYPDPKTLIPPPGAAKEQTASLVSSALMSAAYSRAAFSGCFSAAAIQFGQLNGQIFSGCYIESAAFNPSVLPLNSALVSARLAGKRFSDITRAVLIESQSLLSNVDDSRYQLHLMSPNAKFDHFLASFHK